MYVTHHGYDADFGLTHVEREKPRKRNTQRVTLQPGRHLYLEGDRADRIYEVIQGVLRLTRVTEDGRRQVIAFGYPGDTIGFPSDGRYHTDCDALTVATLAVHQRSDLETASGDGTLHRRLLTATLREISAMQDHFMMLGRKTAVEKLASFLTVLEDRVGEPLGQFNQITLPMNRSDIADFLGLTTETVSRTFTQLRKSGIIAIDRVQVVIILKPRALLAIAKGID